ncbi:adenosylmethionine-8-amino-7-oxononanoate aminotransferase [Bradyrhizobium sp. AZCC 2230]
MLANAFASNSPLTREAMEPFWLPMTPNRQFKAKPRIFVGAEGMHYVTDDGRRILDGVAGLWCVNAGHGQRRIAEATCCRHPSVISNGCARSATSTAFC